MKSLILFLLFLCLISTQPKKCTTDADCSFKCHSEKKICIECLSDNDCGKITSSFCSKNQCATCFNDSSCQRFTDSPVCSPYIFSNEGCISKPIYEQFLNNCCKNEKQIIIKTPSDLLSNPKEDLIFEKQQNKITLNFKTQDENYPKLFLFQRKILAQQQYQDMHQQGSFDQELNQLTIELVISNLNYGENLIELYIIIINEPELKSKAQNPLGGEYFVKVYQKIMIVESKAKYLKQLNEEAKGKNESENNNNTGIIVGAVLGSLAFLAIMGGISVILFRKYKKQNKNLKYQENDNNKQIITEQNQDLKV